MRVIILSHGNLIFKRCKGKSFFEQGDNSSFADNLINSNDDDYKYTTSNLSLFIAYKYEYRRDDKIEDRTYSKKDFFLILQTAIKEYSQYTRFLVGKNQFKIWLKGIQ